MIVAPGTLISGFVFTAVNSSPEPPEPIETSPFQTTLSVITFARQASEVVPLMTTMASVAYAKKVPHEDRTLMTTLSAIAFAEKKEMWENV